MDLRSKIAAQRRRARERRAIRLVRSLDGEPSFEAWQEAGFHLLPVHFYSPVPDTRTLGPDLWRVPDDLAGVDLRLTQGIAWLRRMIPRFASEWNALPRERGVPAGTFTLANGYFESVDAEVAWAMIRSQKPKRIVEIGSGWSTLLARDALTANEGEGKPGTVTAIEPYPSDALRAAARASERITLEPRGVQDVPLETFTSLRRNDVLFIDSSHVGRIGSDVLYEFLEILPRLAPGVVVHVHDIFLPAEYPEDWVRDLRRFWNEQYFLRAFLAMNDGYEVLWAGAAMHLRHPELLEEAFDSYDRARVRPGSFWMRRV